MQLLAPSRKPRGVLLRREPHFGQPTHVMRARTDGTIKSKSSRGSPSEAVERGAHASASRRAQLWVRNSIAGRGEFRPNRAARGNRRQMFTEFVIADAVSGRALFDLSGRVAVVTGGNRGIGLGIALGLAGAGADVAILGRDAERNEQARADIQALLRVRSLAVQLDLTDRAVLEPAFAQIERGLGPVGILVNNAGIARSAVGACWMNRREESWGQRARDATARRVPALEARRRVDACRQSRQDHQHRQHLFVFSARKSCPPTARPRARSCSSRARWRSSSRPTNIQVNLIAPGMDRDGDDGGFVRMSAAWNDADPDANAGPRVGANRRTSPDRRVSCSRASDS
jgi:hypothetical protein